MWLLKSVAFDNICLNEHMCLSIFIPLELVEMLFDFSKVFDTICHAKLVEKMKQFDIPPSTLNWIVYFLTDRTQSVVINGKQSLRFSVTSSIVHWSGLEPFLFLIHVYILDLRPLSSISIM